MSTLTFRLREVNEADIPALARLHVHTFNETHRGGQPGGPSYALREHQWREAFERQDGSWFCYVIEDDRSELVVSQRPHGITVAFLDMPANSTRSTCCSVFIVRDSGGFFSARSRVGLWNAASRRCCSSVMRRIHRTASMRRSAPYGCTASAVNFMAATDGPTWTSSPLDAAPDFTGTRCPTRTRLFPLVFAGSNVQRCGSTSQLRADIKAVIATIRA
jgi:hypothetical protein